MFIGFPEKKDRNQESRKTGNNPRYRELNSKADNSRRLFKIANEMEKNNLLCVIIHFFYKT